MVRLGSLAYPSLMQTVFNILPELKSSEGQFCRVGHLSTQSQTGFLLQLWLVLYSNIKLL